MAEPILYCDRCGNMIDPRDQRKGLVVRTREGIYCVDCARDVGLTVQPAPGGAPGASRGTPRPTRGTPRPSGAVGRPSRVRRKTPLPPDDIDELPPEGDEVPNAPGGSNLLMILGAGGGLLVGLVVALVILLPGEKRAPEVQPPDVPAVPALVPVPLDVPAADAAPTDTEAAPPPADAGDEPAASPARELARIKGLITPTLDKYDEILAALDALVASASESPQAVEAKILREKVVKDYYKLADDALAYAIKAGDEMVARGQQDAAASGLRAIRGRFARGDWLATKGEAAIAEALERLKTRRTEIKEATAKAIAKAYTSTGLALNGSFEVLDKQRVPYLWTMMRANVNMKVVEEDGNHFVRITKPQREHSSYLTGGVEVDPAWKLVRVSARVRSTNLQGIARVDCTFLDAKGEEVGARPRSPAIVNKDTDWTEIAEDIPLPPDARYLRLRPGMFGSKGEVDFDDVTVAPAAPPAQDRNIFPYGSFTISDHTGKPAGWRSGRDKMIGEGNDRRIRFTSTDPKQNPNFSTRIPVDPSWKRLRVSVRFKAWDLQTGTESWHDGRLAMQFQDMNHEMVGKYPSVPYIKKDSDWVTKSVTIDVPEGAQLLVLQPALFHARGNLEIDDIRVSVVEAEGGGRVAVVRPSGAEALAAARGLIDGGKYDDARAALAERTGWPDADVATAQALLKEIDQRERLAATREKRDEPWTAFLIDFTKAGAGGLAKAKAVVAEHRARLEEARKDDRLAAVEKRLRDARLVESLIEDGLLNSRKLFRTKRDGAPVSGRVKKIAGGVLTLKPVVRDAIDIPFAEIPPEDLVKGAELVRLGTVSQTRIAGYYFSRGALDAAAKLVETANARDAVALREDIETVKAADLPDEPIAAVEVSTERVDSPQVVDVAPKDAYQTGLLAEYFDSPDLKSNTVVGRELVKDIQFNWRQDGPAEGLRDNFSARWSGQLKVPAAGEYEFKGEADDNVRVWVDGKRIINHWEGKKGVGSGKTRLRAGWVSLRVEYAEVGGDADLKLTWWPTGGEARVVGGDAVRMTGDVEPVEEEVVDLPKGPPEPLPGETGKPGQWSPGLVCEIFAGKKFTDRIGVRIDAGLDGSFGGTAPDLDAPRDKFAMRWTGWLLVPRTEKYTFQLKGDNYATVRLDDKVLAKASHGKDVRTPMRTYEAGLHPIVVTLVEDGGGAGVHLSWMGETGKVTEIPDEYFYHEVPEIGSMGPFATLVSGLRATYYMGDNFNRKAFETRVDTVNFDAEFLPMTTLLPKDRCSVRFDGYLYIRNKGKYYFAFDLEGGARVKIAGTTLIDWWNGRPKEKDPEDITMELAGGYQKFQVEYKDIGAAKFIMKFSKEKWKMKPIGPHDLRVEWRKGKQLDRAGLAPGIPGKLYAGITPGRGKALYDGYFGNLVMQWKDQAPAEGVPADNFSAAWQGAVVVPEKGNYTFRVRHFDGVTLNVMGRPVVSKWSAVDGWQKATVPLRAGKVPVTLSYFNRDGDAGVEVYWSGPRFGFRPLAHDALAHEAKGLPIAAAWKEEPVAVAKLPDEPAALRDPLLDDEKKEPVEPPPVGNQVRNSGFEDYDAEKKFPRFWTAYEGTRAGAGYSIRTDRTNPHDGERALVVRSTREGLEPGMITSMTLPAATYRLTFFASCDFDKKATVCASLAGVEMRPVTVGEEYVKFEAEFTLPKKKVGASLRFWTTSANVRVYFDDVEVEAVVEEKK